MGMRSAPLMRLGGAPLQSMLVAEHHTFHMSHVIYFPEVSEELTDLV